MATIVFSMLKITSRLQIFHEIGPWQLRPLHSSPIGGFNAVIPSNQKNCQFMATLERWPLARGRCKCIHSSSGKDLWLYWCYWRGWPVLKVATKRWTTVHACTDCFQGRWLYSRWVVGPSSTFAWSLRNPANGTNYRDVWHPKRNNMACE